MPQLLQPLAITRLTWLTSQANLSLADILAGGYVLLDSDGNYLMDSTGHVLYVDDVVLLRVFGADTLGGLWGPELQHAALDASSLYLSSLALGAR
jgi:hypothetical protein